MVSTPSDKGVTSNSNISFISPLRTPPCIEAPIATASSGLISFLGAFPKNFSTSCCTLGIRVCPPTRITSSISLADNPASFKATLQGSIVLLIRSSTRDSNLLRVTCITRCFGPELSAVTYGMLISVCIVEDSSIFAFSADSLSRCIASGSPLRSKSCSFLNSSAMYSINLISKSSPPRKVFPLVDKTSICCCPSTLAISMIETSNVPPPRS